MHAADVLVLVARHLGESAPGGAGGLLAEAAQRLAEQVQSEECAGLVSSRRGGAASSDAGNDPEASSARDSEGPAGAETWGWDRQAPGRERLTGSLSLPGGRGSPGHRGGRPVALSPGSGGTLGSWAPGSPRGQAELATRRTGGSSLAATSLPQINSMMNGVSSGRAALLGQTGGGSPGKEIMPGDWRRDVKLRRWLGERDDKEKDRKKSRHKMLSSDLKWLQRSETRQKDLMEAMRIQAKRKGAASLIQKHWRELQAGRLINALQKGGK